MKEGTRGHRAISPSHAVSWHDHGLFIPQEYWARAVPGESVQVGRGRFDRREGGTHFDRAERNESLWRLGALPVSETSRAGDWFGRTGWQARRMGRRHVRH